MESRAFSHLISTLAGASLLASCTIATVFPALRNPRKVAFDESALSAYGRPGSATVDGRLIVTDDQGRPHIGIESDVVLFPVTAYTKETVTRVLGDGVDLVPTERNFRKYRLIATCDRAGNFHFDHVAAGEYFVIGSVLWSDQPEETTFQWACERITVAPHQPVSLALTHNPRNPGKPVLGPLVKAL